MNTYLSVRTGLDEPAPGSSVAQSKFVLSSHWVGISSSWLTPVPFGPRNRDQDSAEFVLVAFTADSWAAVETANPRVSEPLLGAALVDDSILGLVVRSWDEGCISGRSNTLLRPGRRDSLRGGRPNAKNPMPAMRLQTAIDPIRLTLFNRSHYFQTHEVHHCRIGRCGCQGNPYAAKPLPAESIAVEP